MTWLHVVGMICLLGVTVMVVFHRRQQEETTKRTTATNLEEEQKEYLPLHVGNEWTYQCTVTDGQSGKARKEIVREAVARLEGNGYRIIQEVNGRQEDSRVATPTARGLEMLEFDSQREPVLFLAGGELQPGLTWDMAENRRARVESLDTVQVGTAEVDALKIREERYFGKDSTDEPGWLPQGCFWLARGIGIVKRDSSSARRPRGNRGRPPDRNTPDLEKITVLELQSYKVKSGE